MNSLSKVLIKSGHDIYENIVYVVIISIIWFIFIFPAIFVLTPYAGVIYFIFTSIPAFTAILYLTRQRIDRKSFSYKLFFTGLKKFYIRTFIYSMLFSIFVMIPVSSWWYYFQTKTMFTFIIAVIQTYLFIFIILSQVYFLPLLVSENKNLISAINMSIKLFLDNGMYTFGSLIQIISVSILLLVTIVGVPLLWAGMVSIFLINLYDNLLLKYMNQEEINNLNS